VFSIAECCSPVQKKSVYHTRMGARAMTIAVITDTQTGHSPTCVMCLASCLKFMPKAHAQTGHARVYDMRFSSAVAPPLPHSSSDPERPYLPGLSLPLSRPLSLPLSLLCLSFCLPFLSLTFYISPLFQAISYLSCLSLMPISHAFRSCLSRMPFSHAFLYHPTLLFSIVCFLNTLFFSMI